MASHKTPVTWLRPLECHEEYHDITQKNNTFMTIYRLALAAAQPIKEDDFVTALKHLFRKVINLRLTIREKQDNGKLWFCEMENEKIDFEMICDKNIQDVFEKMGFDSYDSYNGPLWRAKLQYELNQICSLPELEDIFPHQYTLLLGTHHSIIDGHSKHVILKLFLTILNDVIANKPISDEQFRFLSDGVETKQMIYRRRKQLEANQTLSRQIELEVDGLRNLETHLNKLTCNYQENRPRSLHLTKIIQPEINKMLIDKFKSIGISFHAGFFSLVDTAFVEMMKEKGIYQSEYTIGSIHAVNCRRYWTGDNKTLALGNNYGEITISLKVSHDVRSHVLDHMKAYHNKISEYLKTNRHIDEHIYGKITNKLGQEVSLEEYLDDPPPTNVYYVASNMTDVTSLIGTGGDHVQLTWFSRSTSIQKMHTPLTFMIHSYRGRLIIGVDYSTRAISTAFITTLVNKIVHLCNEFVQ